jgi:protocatechuate 3,4-dioxygenase alpha subunit
VSGPAPLTPAQTVGPFLSLGLDWPDGPSVVDPGTPGAIRIGGRLLDGQGEPVGDGLVETWQPGPDGRFPAAGDAFRGFGRCLTAADGSWEVVTLKPGPPGAGEAPHLDVSVFARGLLHRLVTRIYFGDEDAANAADPVLRSLPDDAARATLRAQPVAGGYRLDIHLQGPRETVFFVL